MSNATPVPPQSAGEANPPVRLELQGLRVELGGRTLCLEHPCTLRVGRLYLVSGPSGSGKSSFARALLGFGELADPTIPCAGDVTLFDARGREHSIWAGADYDPASREEIAFLPQAERLGFIDGLSAQENLRLFSHLPAADAERHARELAQRFHLAAIPPAIARASGGERIRLSAVRGLLPRRLGEGPPPLVVADEPTAGLDPQAARALATELIDLASIGESIVVVITHDPQLFVPRLPESAASESPEMTGGAKNAHPAVRLLECTLGDHAAREVCEIGRLQLRDGEQPPTVLDRFVSQGVAALQTVGAVVLAPFAFVWGLAGLRRPAAVVRQVLGDVLNPGTHLFSLTGSVLVAGTVAYFIFEQTPRPELVEPLLLPEILKATGHTLVRVVLPLGACALVATKLGAAQAARLASAVRSGLLETLALARWRLESFALVPAVVAQILCMAIATGLALAVGVVVAALVYASGHPEASLRLSLDLMLAGPANAPDWLRFLAAKVICSGFLAGSVAALFGHLPGTSEDDVARAVHRTLLWGVLCVIACQCLLIIAEFAGS